MATRDTYTKVHEDWKDKPDKTTPVLAEDLEHIEQGIKDAADKRALKEIYGDTGANIGDRNSVNIAANYIIIGYDNISNGFSSAIIVGSGNKGENGGGGICAGTGNTIRGGGNFVSGQYNEVNDGASGAVGQGLITVAQQMAVGLYNQKDEQHKFAFIVGGGTSNTNRKNIHTVDRAGNAYYAGDVTNGVGVSLNSLKSDVDNLTDISTGSSIAKVFDTKADLDAWLEIEGNAETLVIGQNIYITATGTPDYWWDGTGLQVLETDKVEIESMTYDETMAILNATAEEVE